MKATVTMTLEVDGKRWTWTHEMSSLPLRVEFNRPGAYTIPWDVVDTTPLADSEGLPADPFAVEGMYGGVKVQRIHA